MGATVYAGTVGWGVWLSRDLGETWEFAFRGLNAECRIWSLSWHPGQPDVVWAGSDGGLLRQRPDGTGERVPSPADALQVWALAQPPADPDVLILGTNPGHLFLTDDGGANWRELPIDLVDECLIGKPRITRIRFDPLCPDRRGSAFWASAEIDAVHRTTDGGDSWQRCEAGFKFPDIHDLAVVDDAGQRKLLAATAVGLYRSTDDGRSWQWQRLESPWQYTRGIKPRADLNGTVFLCNGDGPPGSQGRLLRSRDWGENWEDAGLPGPTNSTPWTVAANEADPALLFACTILGQLFRSTDGGETWTKLPRELGEIRALLWHP